VDNLLIYHADREGEGRKKEIPPLNIFPQRVLIRANVAHDAVCQVEELNKLKKISNTKSIIENVKNFYEKFTYHVPNSEVLVHTPEGMQMLVFLGIMKIF
jgi:hypothetical protein